jgi:hypothetical protein
MRPIPIAQYLNQMARVEPTVSPPLVAEVVRPRLVMTPEETERRIQEAYARGLREGRESVQAEADERIEQTRADLRADQERARAAAGAEAVSHLSVQISEGFENVHARIAEGVARVVRPVLTLAQARLVERTLADGVARLLSNDGPELLRISGPAVLLAELKKQLAGRPVRVQFTETQGVEVTVRADQTIIQTRLEALAGALDKALD